MIHKLRTSISKPKLTVFFIKDRFSKVILYMLLITTLLIIPNLIKIAVNKDMDINRKTELYETLRSFSNFEIQDGTLIFSKTENYHFEFFNVSIGEIEFEMRYNIVFSEKYLIFYAYNRELKRATYNELGLNNIILNNNNLENYQILTNAVANFINSENMIHLSDIFYAYFVNIMDYIMISLMLVVMTVFFPTTLKFSFSDRFKMTVYLMTSWVLSQLIIKLFQIEFLEIISLIVVYVYHVILYRFLRTLKVEIVNVEK